MFTPRTVFPNYTVPLSNFPGHHRKALQSLKQLAFQIDLVLELRDARAPLSTMNPLLQTVLPGKPRYALYTKSDLSTLKAAQLNEIHPDGRYAVINAEDPRAAKRVKTLLRDYATQQFPRPPLGTRVLIAGMPNVGKSSLLNNLRGRRQGAKKVAQTGARPGVTRAVSELVTIDKENQVYVLDTPGVVVPRAWNAEHMLKLCLVGAVPRSLVDPVILADYLLFKINQVSPDTTRKCYPGAPTNDIMELLKRFAKRDEFEETGFAAQWVDNFIRGSAHFRILFDEINRDSVRAIEDAGRAEAERLNLAALPVDMRIRRRFMM